MEPPHDSVVLTHVLDAVDLAHPRAVQCRTALALTDPVGLAD
ncbi:hypothetical protein [Streptomyces sp. HUAS TT20]|nr:hypothetical protein [Streptomyces sp. HUAS 15-9]UXY32142.1 hypothetical protein N8I87_40160 [Streptomyces sp. HUAS 15-9]